jgi:hypothetical protein
MSRAHERFPGARVVVTFAFAVFSQMALTLAVIRLGLWGFLLATPLFFVYVIVFGRGFLLALRRMSLLRHATLRFPTAIFCTIFLLFCSFSLGAYIGATLNSTIFHMPVENFDR